MKAKFLLEQKGYRGGLRTLQRYLSSLREAQGCPSKCGNQRRSSPGVSVKVRDPQSPPLTSRRVACLLIKRQENLKLEETDLLTKLVNSHPDFSLAIDLAKGFLELIRDRLPDSFDDWLLAAFKVSLKPFQSFAQSLSDDYDAVKASMSLEVGNGPVEGLNNRLKMLKRQMYGRAGLELLSKRLILAQ